MNLKIELCILSGDYEEYNLIEESKNTYTLNCYIRPNIPIEKILNNSSKIKKDITKQYIDIIEEAENHSKLIRIFDKFLNEKINLLNICESITIDSEDEDQIINYLKDNPILLTKKRIIIRQVYNLNDFEYVKEKYKNIPNLYFYIEGNKEPIDITDYEKTVNVINEITSKIKKFNFSPLEQIMYAYDLVRDRVYQEETEEESDNVSRDLTQVLLGDKIVCVGYAVIFEKVLSNLGIKAKQHSLTHVNLNKIGHRRNIVYIKDEKYNIEGVYYFDPTWDSKKSENDKNYLKSYYFFAKTKEQMDTYEDGKYESDTFKELSKKIISQTKELLKKGEIENITECMIFSINEISRFIDDKDLFKLLLNFPVPELKEKAIKRFNIEYTLKQLDKYNDLFTKPLNANILLKALYNVRKIQYYENPEKYAFDFETFSTIAYNSHWNFDNNSQEFLTNITFHKVPSFATSFKEDMNDYSTKTELEKSINQVRLTKVLRNIKTKKEKD